MMYFTKLLILVLLISLEQSHTAADIVLDQNQLTHRNLITKPVITTYTDTNKLIHLKTERSQIIDKRTLTPNTVDTPDNIPITPEMIVEIPDTPDTPDTKTKIPEIKDTQESSGFQFSGSGDDASYSEVESGQQKPIRLLSPFSNATEKMGNFSVRWKPFNKNTSKIQIKGSNFNTEIIAKDQTKDAENKDMITEEIYTKLEKDIPGPKNASMDKTMLDFFFERYDKKSKFPTTNGHSKKKKHSSTKLLLARSHLYKAVVDKVSNASKKQDMEFDENQLNEGPIGKVVTSEGGLEGLGGDMHGYPAGMGAGAEPLGAFDSESPTMGTAGGPQGVDDKSERFGGEDLARPFSENAESLNNFESRSLDSSVSPNEPSSQDSSVSPNGPGSQFGGLPSSGINEPQVRAVSMSNSIENIDDSVNIQGDSDIGKMVRNIQLRQHAGIKQQKEEPQQQLQQDFLSDPSANELDSGYSSETGNLDGRNFAADSTANMGLAVNDEFSNLEAIVGKRRLAKQTSKPKTHFKKPFKKLQHKN